jgi:hypothetical protein
MQTGFSALQTERAGPSVFNKWRPVFRLSLRITMLLFGASPCYWTVFILFNEQEEILRIDAHNDLNE